MLTSVENLPSRAVCSPRPGSSQSPIPPSSQKRLEKDKRQSSPADIEIYKPLQSLIHHIPSTSSFLTSSVEQNNDKQIIWIVQCWSLCDSTNGESNNDIQPNPSDESHDQSLQNMNTQEDQLMEISRDTNEEYDEETTAIYKAAIEEASRMVAQQQLPTSRHKTDVERAAEDANNRALASIDAITHAWNFGWITIDFDSHFTVILDTGEGEVILNQASQPNGEMHKTEPEKQLYTDELIYWLSKLLSNFENHPISSSASVKPAWQPKYELDPLVQTFKREIALEEKRRHEIKRKFDEIIRDRLVHDEDWEEDVPEKAEIEERRRKLDIWIEEHSLKKKKIEQQGFTAKRGSKPIQKATPNATARKGGVKLNLFIGNKTDSAHQQSQADRSQDKDDFPADTDKNRPRAQQHPSAITEHPRRLSLRSSQSKTPKS
ncbi:uncharacterized protein L201_002060 [Kwoniella dendrophila CBS 6074]|uniref:Uncharacterized protein n=1 Tax=Kwoniella dendrophila CBS 6074 TaxID=1295534 RepID=A0AAX4JR33_9TREE